MLRPATSDSDVYFDTYMMQYHLPPSDLREISSILDLGSNIGLTMCHYAERYCGARIVGIEMDAENCSVCRANTAPYSSRCSVIEGAVWHENGTVAYSGTQAWGFRITQEAALRAEAYTVDRILNQCGLESVDFVKMDIEGAEREVLRRASRWSGRVRCIKVETHDDYTVEMCIRDLVRAGFDCTVDDRHRACVVGRSTALFDKVSRRPSLYQKNGQ